MKKLVTILLLTLNVSAWGQDWSAQTDSAEWWAAQLKAQPGSQEFASKTYTVTTGGGTHTRPYEKVIQTNPLSPSPSAVKRVVITRTYIPIYDSKGVLRGLANQGWSYQTSPSTQVKPSKPEDVIYKP